MEIPNGNYSYRFKGFSVEIRDAGPWFLVGIGSLIVNGSNFTDGLHCATIQSHLKAPSYFDHGRYRVSGSYKWIAEERHFRADLEFKQYYSFASSPIQSMKAQFLAVPSSGDYSSFWLISRYAEIVRGNQSTFVNEVVEGEMKRVSLD